MASDDQHQTMTDTSSKDEQPPKEETKPFEIRFDEISSDGKRISTDLSKLDVPLQNVSLNGEPADGKNDDVNKLMTPSNEVVKKSCMEEEYRREKRYNALLKECTHILKQEEQKYTKESLRRVFQDEVSFFLNTIFLF